MAGDKVFPASGERIIRTQVTERAPMGTDTAEILLEAWIAQQAVLGIEGKVARIHVFKRTPAGKMTHMRKWTLDPPFDMDVETIFQALGDGEYRFVPLDKTGRWLTARHENVTGFGKGDGRDPGTPGTTSGSSGTDGPDVLAGMREIIEIRKTEMLMATYDRMLAQNAPTAAYEPAPAASLDMDLDRLTKLAALLRPASDPTAGLMDKLFSKLLRDPEPVEKQLELAGKLADLMGTNRAEPESLDWKTIAMVAVLGMLSGGAGGAMASGMPGLQGLIARFMGGVPAPGAEPAIGAGPAPRPLPPPGPPPAAVDPGSIAPAPAADPIADAARALGMPAWILGMLHEAIVRQDTDYERYADMLDTHAQGLLELWAAHPADEVIGRYGAVVPFLAEPPAAAWLRAFHAFVVSDWLQRGEGDAPQEPQA